MKKILIAALLLASSGAFAQAGSLTISNGTICTVIANMRAIAPAEGYPVPCMLQSNQIILPPGSGFSSPNPVAFAGMVGFSGTSYPGTGGDFQWTDIDFQFECPMPPCGTDAGSYVNQPVPGQICAISYQPSWTSPGGCTSASWGQIVPGGTPLNNVKIGF